MAETILQCIILTECQKMQKAERDLILAIPFNDVLGCSCPMCNSVAIGLKLKFNMHYCPYCGQHLKMVSVNNGDWAKLEADVKKIHDVMETNIVVCGYGVNDTSGAKKHIEGVFMDRWKAYKDDHAQIEGQMSMF